MLKRPSRFQITAGRIIVYITFLFITFLYLNNILAQETQEKRVDKLSNHPTIQKMLIANNTIRRKAKLPSYELSEILCKQAQKWAQHMAETNALSHSRLPYRENIAWNYKNINSVFNGWLHSAGHRQNLLSNTKFAGFGMAKNKKRETYWCVIYTNIPRNINIKLYLHKT